MLNEHTLIVMILVLAIMQFIIALTIIGCWSNSRDHRQQIQSQLTELIQRKLRNSLAEVATAAGGRIPLTYLPNSPTLNGL